MEGVGGTPLFGGSWDEVSAAIGAQQTYLVSTVGSEAEPHVVPVLGLWLDERLYFNSSNAARKVRNLAANNRIAISAVAEHSDYVLRGTARPVYEVELLQRVADAFPSKYTWWHSEVRDGRFVAPDDDQPRTVFEVTPALVLAFGREGGLSASRWDFEPGQ